MTLPEPQGIKTKFDKMRQGKLFFMETLRFLSAQNGLPTVAGSAKGENGRASDLSLSILC